MKNNNEWDLILKYLDNTLNSAETQRLQEWIRSDPQNRKMLQNIEQIWNTPGRALSEPRTDLAWQKCKQAAGIDTEDIPKHISLRLPEKNTPLRQNSWHKKLWRYAAVFLILILIPFAFSLFTDPPPLKELHVQKTQKMKVTLSDGTRIALDAGSTIHYPENFNSPVRQVYLSGEGYFEVTSNPEKPFIVKTNGALIRVLGTKFNIRAWQQRSDARVTVAVLEGNVSLQTETPSRGSQKVIISAGQMSELIPHEAPTPPRSVNIRKYTSWMEREMHFENASLGEVLGQLERWYDREIILPDSSLSNSRVTLFIEDKPITETLHIISMMKNLSFREEGHKIIFSYRDKPLSFNQKNNLGTMVK